MTTALRFWFYLVLCIAGLACGAIGVSLLVGMLK